jgi:DDE superfamily endonuclease
LIRRLFKKGDRHWAAGASTIKLGQWRSGTWAGSAGVLHSIDRTLGCAVRADRRGAVRRRAGDKLVDLTLVAEHRRGHGAMDDALNHGRVVPQRFRRTLASLPLPRTADQRIVLAVDVSVAAERGARLADGYLPPAGIPLCFDRYLNAVERLGLDSPRRGS